MKTIPHIQGSAEWAAVRQTMRPASEASAMMGQSKYLSRTDLLKQRKTGITPEVDGFKQALFDKGHATEASARAILEDQLGEELYPIVGSDDAGYLMASFDGIDMLGLTGFEHKLYSESLAAQVRAGQLDMHYVWQMEQQILVGGLERIIFVCSDGTRDKWEQMEYRAQPGLADKLLAGWQQFDKDLADYAHDVVPEPAQIVVAAPDELPALMVQITGAVTASNLDAFKAVAMARIEAINTSLDTDEDFAIADKTVKFLDDGEKRLAMVKEQALSQTADIAALFSAIDSISEQMRAKRLTLDKLVKARKDSIRTEIIQGGKDALRMHINNLNARLGNQYIGMPMNVDFAAAIKGKRTIASLRDACDTLLATAKIAANETADRIQINLAAIKAAGNDSLFADASTLVHKAPDDLALVISSRIAQHEAREAQRIADERARMEAQAKAAAEREREKIAAEERTKIEAEQRAAEAQRLRAESLARQADAAAVAAREAAEQTTVAAEPAAIIPKATTPSDEAVVLGGKMVEAPMTGARPLRLMIDDLLAEMNAQQLQQALDALRAIRARRAA